MLLTAQLIKQPSLAKAAKPEPRQVPNLFLTIDFLILHFDPNPTIIKTLHPKR